MVTIRPTARSECIFFLCAIIFLLLGSLSACSQRAASTHVVEALPSPTPALQTTAMDFYFGDPIVSDAQALIAAYSALRASFTFTEPLTVVLAQQMSDEAYNKFILASNYRQAGTQVWLVIYFDDRWQDISPTPKVTSLPPFRGCVSVAINAADGLPLEVGGPLLSGILSNCDH